MKTIKCLIPGLAAGLFAMSGAQAADLPVKAKAVEYVRICSLYGAGFFYIPGTDTCIKLGGYLRADLTINGGIYDAPFWNGEGAIRDRYANFYTDRSRLALTIDTRTATEYGVVRTFGQADFQFSSYGSTSSIGSAASPFLTGVGTAYGGNSGPEFVGNVRVDQAWGLFQISGAIHDDHAGYFSVANTASTALGGTAQTGAVNFGHPDDKYGGAV